MTDSIGIVMFPNGNIGSFTFGKDILDVLRQRLEDVHAVHLLRPDTNEVAVGWHSRTPQQAVNEAATALCRHAGAIHPLGTISGVFMLTGIDDDGHVGPPPAWASEAAYRYAKKQRDRMAPPRRWSPTT